MFFFINIEEPFFFLTIMSTREVYVRLVTKETLLPPRPHPQALWLLGKREQCRVLRLGKEPGHHATETPLYVETVENHRSRAPSGVY